MQPPPDDYEPDAHDRIILWRGLPAGARDCITQLHARAEDLERALSRAWRAAPVTGEMFLAGLSVCALRSNAPCVAARISGEVRALLESNDPSTLAALLKPPQKRDVCAYNVYFMMASGAAKDRPKVNGLAKVIGTCWKELDADEASSTSFKAAYGDLLDTYNESKKWGDAGTLQSALDKYERSRGLDHTAYLEKFLAALSGPEGPAQDAEDAEAAADAEDAAAADAEDAEDAEDAVDHAPETLEALAVLTDLATPKKRSARSLGCSTYGPRKRKL